MKPPSFSYSRPETIEEALAALAEGDPDAKLLAGGQSLVPILNLRLARPTVLVDLNRVAGLDAIQLDGVLRVGAMVRQRALELSRLAREVCPLLPLALKHVGHIPIRNRGTIGGSLAHADPAAELPTVALALDADLVVASPSGGRNVPASSFFQGPLTTALQPDEILTEIRFPVLPDRRVAFREFARRRGDFALAAVAAVVRLEQGTATDVRLAACGVESTPVRLTIAEGALRGRALSPSVIRDAANAAAHEVSPVADIHADAEYRRELLGVLVGRALAELAA